MDESSISTESMSLTNPLVGRKRSNLSIWIWMLFIIASIIFVNAYPPANQFLTDLEASLQRLGWIGTVITVAVLGLIIIPLALPYYIVETSLALILNSFWEPLMIAGCSKMIGCSLCYFIGTTCLRARITHALESNKIFKSINIMLSKAPWKFSFIFRIILMPYFVKNYGLAVAPGITYWAYIVPGMITGVGTSAINIHLVQAVKNLSGVGSSYDTQWTNPLSLSLSILSIVLLVWMVIYTYNMVKRLEREERALARTSTLQLTTTKDMVAVTVQKEKTGNGYDKFSDSNESTV
jgi:uncharacterized membrane protein YdjX (TVP38/TMEM64 family)